MHFLLIAAGIGLLVLGGDLLIRGAVRLAAHFGVSALMIGLTVVAFGTSAPELAVSLQSVQAGAADLAVGNVVGSNIFNVLVIVGLSATLLPLSVSRRVVWVEVPIMIAITLVAIGFAIDGRVGRADGVLLLALVAVYSVWLIRTGSADAALDGEPRPDPGAAPARSAVLVLAGLGLLVLGARWLVSGSVTLARTLGVDEAVIGLTIVAAGTSLPEVAASVIATVRGHRDLAVGNVLGSNIFNLTVILGTTAAVADGIAVAPGVLRFDVPVMLAVSVACLPIFYTGHVIARWEGLLFLGYYVAYMVYLALDATGHALLPQFEDAMRYFAIPLTIVTMAVVTARSYRRSRKARRRRRGTAPGRSG